MKPFFTFFGGKWRAAPHYPAPVHDTIVEPFAGSAGYSVRHNAKRVILVEKDPKIAAVWAYLIAASPKDILNLPDLKPGQSVNDLKVSQPAKWLIGFWLNKANYVPCLTPSAWMRAGLHPNSFWGDAIRQRIASQVESIAHWEVVEGDYRKAPAIKATWFVDPPYMLAGKVYVHSSKGIDYAALASWVLSRRGQVIACENTGADWLPFVHFMDAKSTEGVRGKSVSKEAIWTND